MKQQIKKLLYPLLMAFISIGISFNTEARLPKHMAQRAAELLIEKSELQLKAGATKEAFAANLVDFLYSTKKRQNLTNWFRLAFIGDIQISTASQDIKDIMTHVNGVTHETAISGSFVNQRFPCWTGTLTCFMMNKNNKAMQALSEGKVVERCQESLNSPDGAYKVVGILFTLELVDNWDDVKRITGSAEDAPAHPEQYDPYDCVPVPNTAYIRFKKEEPGKEPKKYYQGSCMISTVRNLVYMLCRTTSDSTEIVKENMKEDIKTAFSDLIHTVPGTTSESTLKGFAEKILPGITDQYQPTLELFVCTLNSLLRVDMQESIAIPTPHQYISGSLGIHQGVIESILRKITNHNGHLTVTLNNNPTKLSNDWPQSCLIINDLTVNKKITIAFGLRGTGYHVEIIDITHADH